MKQYCRYCGLCCETDGGYWCSAKQKMMRESTIKRANTCTDYGYTDVGDVINGGQYTPRMLPPLCKGDDKTDLLQQLELLEEGKIK